jgi:hypothetical protein
VSTLYTSAHDLCRTRLCQASQCENDAEPGWLLCDRCEKRRKRGYAVKLHEVVQPQAPDPETMLLCCDCSTWKLDEAFCFITGRFPSRRNRRLECTPCSSERKRRYRANLSPEKRAEQDERHAANARARRLKQKAAS